MNGGISEMNLVSRSNHRHWSGTALGCLVLVGACAGCGNLGPPSSGDRAEARTVLNQALAAWCRGDSPDSLKAASPPILVSDHQWQGGHRLISYELDASDRTVGADSRIKVKLRLEAPRGKRFQAETEYTVATRPVITVVREDDV